MIKRLMYLILLLLIGGSWFLFSRMDHQLQDKQKELSKAQEMRESDSYVAKLEGELHSIEGQRIFSGVLLAFLSAGIVGIVFVVLILPSLAHRFTHAIYDSAEMLEHDVMHDARSLLAQGDYEGAIAAFRQAAAAEPLNRLPWVEITKIYKEKLGDMGAAIETVKYALESQEWEVNDAAYLLFRLAELYDEVEDGHHYAVGIMQQVVDQFPGTRHSANASHKLAEWQLAEEEAEMVMMKMESKMEPEIVSESETEPELAAGTSQFK